VNPWPSATDALSQRPRDGSGARKLTLQLHSGDPIWRMKGKSDRFASDAQEIASKVLVARIIFVDFTRLTEEDAKKAMLGVGLDAFKSLRKWERRRLVNPLLNADYFASGISQPVIEAYPISYAGIKIVGLSQANAWCDRFGCGQFHDPRHVMRKQDCSQEFRGDIDIAHVISYSINSIRVLFRT
jgi:hypothetical protein